MFEGYRQYKSILVTGPQRAGTRIGAKMIALDTMYDYVDECQIRSDKLKLALPLLEKGQCVVQAPGLAHKAHELPEDVLVIFMLRPVEDIIVSQMRIGWRCEDLEKRKYGKRHCNLPIARIKYDRWQEQKELIKHWDEIQYDTLSAHPMWEPNRVGFKWNQTEAK